MRGVHIGIVSTKRGEMSSTLCASLVVWFLGPFSNNLRKRIGSPFKADDALERKEAKQEVDAEEIVMMRVTSESHELLSFEQLILFCVEQSGKNGNFITHIFAFSVRRRTRVRHIDFEEETFHKTQRGK